MLIQNALALENALADQFVAYEIHVGMMSADHVAHAAVTATQINHGLLCLQREQAQYIANFCIGGLHRLYGESLPSLDGFIFFLVVFRVKKSFFDRGELKTQIMIYLGRVGLSVLVTVRLRIQQWKRTLRIKRNHGLFVTEMNGRSNTRRAC